MPARNAQNPIKADKGSAAASGGWNVEAKGPVKSGSNVLHCPACNAEVPPKPGFRPSALKCPQCGAAMKK